MKNVFKILQKDLRLAPRSPMFLFAIGMPLLITFLVQVVFGSLFDPSPRLAIVDLGNSEITKEAKSLDGIEVVVLDDVDNMKQMVEDYDFDVGFVLQRDFDELLKSGENPYLEIYISGESFASERIILAVTTLDLIRGVEGRVSSIDIELISLGEEVLPMQQRLVPLVLFYVIFIAGVFVPAMSIVEEREKKTLNALLATPVSLFEFVFAKAILGFILAIFMTLLALFLNDALGTNPFALLVTLVSAIFMITAIGIIFAAVSKDVKSLYTFIKSSGILLFAPVVFYIWNDLPSWVAKIFPTYWMIEPIYRVGIEGVGLGEVWFEIVISVLITIAIIPILMILLKRMEKSLAL